MLSILLILSPIARGDVESCRDRLVAIREHVARVSPQTLGAAEGLRAVAAEAPSAALHLRRFLSADAALAATVCRDGRCGDLTERLLDRKFAHRSAAHVIGRFMDEHGYGRDILQRRKLARTDLANDARKHLLLLTRYQLRLDYQDVFGVDFVEDAVTFMEDRVYADPMFQNDPDGFLNTWKAHCRVTPFQTTPEQAALNTLQHFRANDLRVFAIQAKFADIVSRESSHLSRGWSTSSINDSSPWSSRIAPPSTFPMK